MVIFFIPLINYLCHQIFISLWFGWETSEYINLVVGLHSSICYLRFDQCKLGIKGYKCSQIL